MSSCVREEVRVHSTQGLATGMQSFQNIEGNKKTKKDKYLRDFPLEPLKKNNSMGEQSSLGAAIWGAVKQKKEKRKLFHPEALLT